MSKVGKGIEKAVRGVRDAVFGVRDAVFGVRDAVFGGTPDIVMGQDSKDTTQEETDKEQGTANAAIARRKKRSLLATGINNGVSGGVTQQAKKLLGE